jgi:uncharacterized protein YjbI with pentapeptide repeats
MELRRETPMEVAWQVWEPRPGEPGLTVVVKATYDLPARGEATLADAQRLVTGDVLVEDDIEKGVAYPSDLELLKPWGELLVVGSMHVPAPVSRAQAAVRAGALEKSIVVTGDRAVETVAAPVPFTAMPLDWSRAFGGPGLAANPLGRGLTRDLRTGVVLRPNLERPDEADQNLARPTPTSFAPIPRTWPARLRYAGTYDDAWLATRYPHPATDLDYRMYLSAPPDQQLDGFFRGDERLELLHLHPAHPRVACTLPGHRAQAFLVDDEGGLSDVGLRLDTLVVDADAGQAVLVWRGLSSLPGAALPPALFVVHADDDARPTMADYAAQHASHVAAAEAAERAAEPEPAPRAEIPAAEAPAVAAPGPLLDPADPGARWAHLDQAMTMRGEDASLAAAVAREIARREAPGFRPSTTPPPSVPDDLSPEARLEAEMALALAEMHEPESPRRREVREAVAAGESCAGWDLVGVDLSRLDLAGADFTGALMTRANLSGSVLRAACFDGANLTEAELSFAVFEECRFEETLLGPARAEAVHFIACHLGRLVAPETYFRRGLFTRCDLRRAELQRSDLGESELQECQLDEADLTGAVLERARIQRCSFVDAWCEGLRAPGVLFEACDASLLRASEGADLEGASFRGCTLTGARFGTARLRKADFSLARLGRADFTAGQLAEARFVGAYLREARFDGAALQGASFIKADLLQARFEAAALQGADLRGCNLYQAELHAAQLAGTRLDLADLTGTRLA